MELGELSFFGSPNRVLITENTTFMVPIGVKNIWVTACASGEDGSETDWTYKAKAGDYCIKEHIPVKQGQAIPIIVGDGNTVVGDFITLLKGAAAHSYQNDSLGLGYQLGYDGYDGTNGAAGGAMIDYSYGGTQETLEKSVPFYLSGPSRLDPNITTSDNSPISIYASSAYGGVGGTGGYGGAFGIGGAGAGGGGGGGAPGLTAIPVAIHLGNATASNPYHTPLYGPSCGGGGGGGGLSHNGTHIPKSYNRNRLLPSIGHQSDNSVVNQTLYLRPYNQFLSRTLTEFDISPRGGTGDPAGQDPVDEYSLPYARKNLAGIINFGTNGECGSMGNGTAHYYTQYIGTPYEYKAIPVVGEDDGSRGGNGGTGGQGGDSLPPSGWGAGGGSCGQPGNANDYDRFIQAYDEESSSVKSFRISTTPQLIGERGLGGKGGTPSKGAPGMVLIEW